MAEQTAEASCVAATRHSDGRTPCVEEEAQRLGAFLGATPDLRWI
jgi:hypothetical protein